MREFRQHRGNKHRGEMFAGGFRSGQSPNERVANAARPCREVGQAARYHVDNDVAGIHFYTLNRSDATRTIFDSLGIPRRRYTQLPVA
jgi:hypothetical protein